MCVPPARRHTYLEKQQGKVEVGAGSDNHRSPIPPVSHLRGPRARARRLQLGALPLLPRRHQRTAPGDAHLDLPATRRRRPSRLRVRTPRDAAPPRRRLPVSRLRRRGHPHPTPVMRKKSENSLAYQCGWIDGCSNEPGCFTENPQLARWETPSDRLDYYRGHRDGRETRRRSSPLRRAS